MNRTIKFRGKDIYTNEWIYGSLLTDNKDAFAILVPEIQESGKLKFKHKEVTRETVGQFSGQFDKNGKEIYEGDIIRHHDFSNVYKPDFDGEVIFIKSGFRIKFKSEYDKSGFMYWDLCFDDFANRKIEVIGNIHDNPDLLK